MVWHYLITLGHGSHYDYNIWVYWHYHNPPYSKAFWRVFNILAKGGI